MKKKILLIGTLLILSIILITLTGCNNKNTTNNEGKNMSKNNLSSVVKVGDYVSYKAEEGKTYVAKAENTGYNKDQEFKVTGNESWRVLSINDDGSINLISTTGIGTSLGEDFYLKGKVGYDNIDKEVDNIIKIYATGNLVKSVRSMSVEDYKTLVNFNSNKILLEDKDKINLSNCKTNEEVWEELNKAHDRNYNKKVTIGGNEITNTQGFVWHLETIGDVRFEQLINNDVNVDILNVDAGIYLADKATRIEESEGGTRAYYGIRNYFYQKGWSAGASSYEIDELYRIVDNGTENIKEEDLVKKSAIKFRPVITIKADAKSSGGVGTISNPYTLD